MSNVISLRTREPVEAPVHRVINGVVHYKNCLEIPVDYVLDNREVLSRVAANLMPGTTAASWREAETITAREAAILYYRARRHTALITPEAMPQVRATTLGWLDRWTNEFGTTFPIEAFLPFIVKGRS